MKTLLMILDGWGMTQNPDVSAIAQAKTPFFDRLWAENSHTTLRTDGLFVGLPEGQMGNSEVGHMNIGAGRVVYQNLVRIDRAIESGELAQNKVLQEALGKVKNTEVKLHFIGLVSDGGVHSHLRHLKALCQIAEEAEVGDFYVHAFTDGRDTAPTGGLDYLDDLQETLEDTGGSLASVTGRYFAMDRDKRWERVQKAYAALVNGEGAAFQNPLDGVKASYEAGVTDEFIEPIITVDEAGNPIAKISENDVVICFNFRTDRCRQITQVLMQEDFEAHDMKTLPLHYVTMTRYDANFKNVPVLFDEIELKNTLGEVLEKHGKTQIRIAETEKYPHVTFFFSGGREEPFEGECRIMCPSPKVATYDLQPEMSAMDIRDGILKALDTDLADFICLNFANPDMVGHTGDMAAAIKACETVDSCAKVVIEKAIEQDYAILVIADHGNAETMKTPEGKPHTAHTTNPVPCILVNAPEGSEIKEGKLGDLAPTILELMDVPVPAEMTGEILLTRKK
ncbi:MAG: 2,3-bisphosphoglycerate-independent phosphoglycerate mutase [Bacteroidota bacterium]